MANDKPQGAFAHLMAGGNTPKETPSKEASSAPRTQKQGRTGGNNKVSNINCNITILQSDIEQLRTPTYSVATYRLCDEDTEWVKDTAYQLSKEVKPRKVSQADIVRISFKLFEKMLEQDRASIVGLLQEIK